MTHHNMYYSTAKEMEQLDTIAVEHGLEIRQMMELAGWHMVGLFELLKVKKTAHITILVGKGNKGGDGLAASRHLYNHGWKNLDIVLVSKKIKPDAALHLAMARKMNIRLHNFNTGKGIALLLEKSYAIIDSLIGYHLDGAPRGDFAAAIRLVNESGRRVLSYDLPSGVDATTGKCFEPCVKANATLTLASPKKLFTTKSGRAQSGAVFVGDIGIPDFLYKKITPKMRRPDFGESGLIEL